MRPAAALPFFGLLLAGCGGEEQSAEPVGDPTPQELANRIENVAHGPAEEEKDEPARLGVLQESELPEAYRTGRACRLTRGNALLVAAGSAGAVARVDGRVTQLPIAGPVGPSGGFWEAAGVSISIGLKPPEGAAPGSGATHAGVTVGGASDKPIERSEGSWTCR